MITLKIAAICVCSKTTNSWENILLSEVTAIHWILIIKLRFDNHQQKVWWSHYNVSLLKTPNCRAEQWHLLLLLLMLLLFIWTTPHPKAKRCDNHQKKVWWSHCNVSLPRHLRQNPAPAESLLIRGFKQLPSKSSLFYQTLTPLSLVRHQKVERSLAELINC